MREEGGGGGRLWISGLTAGLQGGVDSRRVMEEVSSRTQLLDHGDCSGRSLHGPLMRRDSGCVHRPLHQQTGTRAH